jgi:uncharacterized protein (DUF433 family)
MNPHVEINPRVCNGKPVIAGTRIPITVILDQLAAGCSRGELKRKYPGITDQQIAGVLQYCHSMIEHTELQLPAPA